MPKDSKDSYTAKNIEVLEGLEPVRKRPGMYIGSTGPDGLHHLIWELINNSIDEALAGFAKKVDVVLLPDGKSVRVSDDGRGIPVDIHPHTKKSALETVMTTLHAGGKFSGGSYKVSGGLHGVGASVVNALSTEMKVEVCRDGKRYVQEYVRGVPKQKVREDGKCTQNGTISTFTPDTEIFKEISFDRKRILEYLREQAFLTKGVRINFSDLRSDVPFYYSFCFEGGIRSFLDYVNSDGDKPIQDHVFYIEKENEGIAVEIALCYTDGVEINELAFANNIQNPEGGMHLTGFKTALTRALNDYARSNSYLKEKEDNLTGEDVQEGLSAIVSIKLTNPQFEGQTKAKLGNPEARTAVDTVMSNGFRDFLEKYKNDADHIMAKCLLAAKARKAAKAAKETILRKGALEGLTLPGKLADCQSRKAEDSELFIVEGDSAGGCFSGDTKVALTDGRNLSFKELVAEEQAGKRNYTYAISGSGNIAVAPILNPRVTKQDAEVIRVTLDNGEMITCTPDHKFMLRDGSYREVQNLKSGDSLMPLYRRLSKRGGSITIEGYEMVYQPKRNFWEFTHILADRHNIERGIYSESSGIQRHHLDFNKLNNNPNNLVRVSNEQHFAIHHDNLKKTIHRADVVQKIRELHKTDAFRKKMSTIMSAPAIRAGLSKRAKRQWEDPTYKKYMVGKFQEFYHKNPVYRAANNTLLDRNQKEYWSNPENVRRQAEHVQLYFAKYPERRELLSALARKQWDNLALRSWRADVTRAQWTDAFRTKRRASYNKTYLLKALAVLHDIHARNGTIDANAYESVRRVTNDKSLLRWDTLAGRFFGGHQETLMDAAVHFNHRVVSVEHLAERMNVYDIEIPEIHNFALAGGVFVHNSAKMARDRRTQAILPLRGKILNVEKSRLDKMLANKEITALIVALGTAVAEDFDISKLRYHKIILMTDADVDGAHIRTLLLSLFYRHFPKVVEGGYLYIAQPPLYRVQTGKTISYAWTDEQKDKLVNASKVSNPNVQRYKGLGEMNPDQLSETTMHPDNRILLKVTIDDAREADHMFDVLMGTDVMPRKHFIMTQGHLVSNLDL
ncbi:ATP-binding protein [Patescibacteria group bacterium]|nr:ATP-binding protein [Patescibacteria group bacterium]